MPIISIFISGILKNSFGLLTFFRNKILIFNIPITKTAIYKCFISFNKLSYIFLYTTIYVPNVFILKIRIFALNKGKSDKISKGVLKKNVKKTGHLFC